jgi:hypothetical protein
MLAGFIITALGGMASVVGVVASASGNGDVGQYLSGGGAAAAVGGLVYVARLMATGQLVARDTHEESETLKDYLERVLTVEMGSAAREREMGAFLWRQK